MIEDDRAYSPMSVKERKQVPQVPDNRCKRKRVTREYVSLNTIVKRIWNKNKYSGCFGRPFPIKAPLSNNINKETYYEYHKEGGHLTKECFSLKTKLIS